MDSLDLGHFSDCDLSNSSNSKNNGNINSNSYGSDCSSYNSYDTGPRKRRTPLSFKLRINPASTSEGETSRDNTTDDSCLSDSTSIAESKDEDDDFNDDLPTPTATAEAATKTDDINEMLSQELLKMSLLDRTDIQEEIHGVRCLSMEESPAILRSSLQEFQRHLDALPDFKKKTYLQIVAVVEESRNQHKAAQQQQPLLKQQLPPPKHYAIDDDDFRLRFLRAALLDPKRAVLRFVNYFEFVHEFWGFGIVSKRQVRLSDFSREELKFFKKGYFQLLPFRDRSGRRVVVVLGENKNDGSINGKKNASYETDSTTKVRRTAESRNKDIIIIFHISYSKPSSSHNCHF